MSTIAPTLTLEEAAQAVRETSAKAKAAWVKERAALDAEKAAREEANAAEIAHSDAWQQMRRLLEPNEDPL